MSGGAPQGRCAGVALEGTSARARLAIAGMLVLGIVALNSLASLAFALAAALLLALAAGCSGRDIARRLLHVEGFLLVLMMVVPFTVQGTAILSLGPLTMSLEGLVKAGAIALKINAAALVILALVASLDTVRLGRALGGLGVPPPLVHLLLMTTRYVGVLRAEVKRLEEAMRARSFTARTSLHTWRSLGNLTGMTLVRSLERAERVQDAMRARGGFHIRAPEHAEPFTRNDALLAITTLAIAAVISGVAWLT